MYPPHQYNFPNTQSFPPASQPISGVINLLINILLLLLKLLYVVFL